MTEVAMQPDLTQARDKKRRFPPWYVTAGIVSFGLVVVGSLLMFVVLFSMPEPRVALWLPLLLGAATVVTLLWFAWAVPLLDATEARPFHRQTPRARRASMALISMAPAFVVGLILGMYVLFMSLENRWDAWRGAMPYAITCAALIAIGLTVSYFSGRTYRKTVAAQRICYHCAYDLRATTGDTCPECGAPIPVAEDTRSA